MTMKINVDGYPLNFDQFDNNSGTTASKGLRKLQRDPMRRRPLLRGSKRWKLLTFNKQCKPPGETL